MSFDQNGGIRYHHTNLKPHYSLSNIAPLLPSGALFRYLFSAAADELKSKVPVHSIIEQAANWVHL